MQLLQHSAARNLLAPTIRKESADPLRNPSIRFAAPKLLRILDKALESIRGVTRDRARIAVTIAHAGKG